MYHTIIPIIVKSQLFSGRVCVRSSYKELLQKFSSPATAMMSDRMDVGTECGARILSSLCKDMGLQDEEGHRTVLIEKHIQKITNI